MNRNLLLMSLLIGLISCQSNKKASINFDFEGGSLGKVEARGTNQWRCFLTGESDSENRNRQVSWYYFQVTGVKGQALDIVLSDLVGEYNYKAGSHSITSETRPVISYDNIHWRHLTNNEVTWDEDKVELALHFKSEMDTIWIAHQAPYTTVDLKSLLDDLKPQPNVMIENIGKTVDGRDIPMVTITNEAVPLTDKKVVFLMGRQHSWESGTSYVVDEALRYLLSDEAAIYRDQIVFKVIPMADPDGTDRGGVRFNKYGHDLNRNWDFVKPAEMPEIAAEKKVITDWLEVGNGIDLFLTLHNTEAQDYIEGPSLPIGSRFYTEMINSTSFESDSLRTMPLSTTIGQPGRMTVYQALWFELKVPAFLMELKVEGVDKLQRRRTIEDWRALGKGLVNSLAHSVTLPPS